MAAIQYNRIIRKLVIGFGNLFNEITLARFNPDLSEAERFIVPIVYGPKEHYVQRLLEDPVLDKKVQTTLPRMSFELVGFTYDPTRKLNTNVKAFASTEAGMISQYNPVPYNFDFNLYIYVRNIEDGTQIIEHILPYFTPDYTIKLNLVPEMGIVKEVPVLLNSTNQDITYEGTRDIETRLIVWTLSFTAKGFIFGKTSEIGGIIKNSITNILNQIGENDMIDFSMDPSSGVGSYLIGDYVYQGYSMNMATASAKVVSWNNNILKLTNINGNFVSSTPIKSFKSTGNYNFVSYNITPDVLATIDIKVDPLTANVSDNWIANTTITEYGS